MKQKKLEIALSKLKTFSSPKPELEQYSTPGNIAAAMLTIASEDIINKSVLDLGCGTGVLSVGAALLGASRVVGVESDETAISIAKENAKEVPVEFIQSPIEEFSGEPFDTVIMNPPFGAQTAHADRPFLEKACQLGKTIYTLSNSTEGGRTFINQFFKSKDRQAELLGTFAFELKATMAHHSRRVSKISVDLWKAW